MQIFVVSMTSMDMMMHTSKKFSNATGLKVNPQKCHLYCAEIDREIKEYIGELTKFKEGKFPFKYLGVPVTNKKLPIQHYMPLIDHVVGKIKHWSARLLSYAGRLQLINSISFALTNYWL